MIVLSAMEERGWVKIEGNRKMKNVPVPFNSVAWPTKRINLPIGMILRCLPAEVLSSKLPTREASDAADTEVGLPMNIILDQLRSGKIEMPLSDLIPYIPAAYLQPTRSISNYLPTMINLPFTDVIVRIPPALLASHSDQNSG